MESPSKRFKKPPEEEALHLLSLPPEVREKIILDLPSLGDIIILARVNKELESWIHDAEIVKRWEERYMGQNGLWRTFLLQQFAFMDELILTKGPRDYIFFMDIQSPQITVMIPFEEVRIKRLYEEIFHGGQFDVSPWDATYLEVESNNRPKLYQFAYRLMEEEGYGILEGEPGSTRVIRACIACGEEAQHICGACGDMEYCGKDCQFMDWPTHQEECIGARHGGGGRRRAKRWIQKTHMKEGKFTRKAKAHHMTPAEFQRAVLSHPEHYDTTTVREANLRKTLVKF